MKKQQNRKAKRPVNPYDLQEISGADPVTKRRPLISPRQENPYSLTRNRDQKEGDK